MAKKHIHEHDTNAFMNSLSEDEFSEFIQQRGLPLEKLEETGRLTDLMKDNIREQDIQKREDLLQQNALTASNQDVRITSEDDLSQEFKVFRDPTFKEFI